MDMMLLLIIIEDCSILDGIMFLIKKNVCVINIFISIILTILCDIFQINLYMNVNKNLNKYNYLY